MPGVTASRVCITVAPSTETPTSSSLTPLVNGPRSTCRNNVPGRQLDCLSHAPIASPNTATMAASRPAAIVNRDGDRIDDLVASRGPERRLGERLAARREQDHRGTDHRDGGSDGHPEPGLLGDRPLPL